MRRILGSVEIKQRGCKYCNDATVEKREASGIKVGTMPDL